MIAQDRMVSRTATSSLGQAANAFATMAGRWLQLWRSRRDVTKLLRLSERELDDIGIQRSDVERALTAAWRQDASQRLSRIRAERQRAAKRRRTEYARLRSKQLSL